MCTRTPEKRAEAPDRQYVAAHRRWQWRDNGGAEKAPLR
jgi:hypothetical protein